MTVYDTDWELTLSVQCNVKYHLISSCLKCEVVIGWCTDNCEIGLYDCSTVFLTECLIKLVNGQIHHTLYCTQVVPFFFFKHVGSDSGSVKATILIR